MALPFALFFTGKSIAIPGTSLTQADATHWMLDTTSTVAPDYHQLQEVAIFLTQPNPLPPDMGLALYVSIGGADWSYRGFVSNSHPSDVLPLSWPEPDASTQQQLAGLAALPPGFAQVGVSVEPLAELAQKEGSKLGAKEDFVKAVAYNLFAFMQSFGAVQALGGDKLLDQWFQKTMDRLRRDPDFLTRRKDAI